MQAERSSQYLFEVREVQGIASIAEHRRLFEHQAEDAVRRILREVAPAMECGGVNCLTGVEGLVERARSHGSARLTLDQETETSILVIRGEAL